MEKTADLELKLDAIRADLAHVKPQQVNDALQSSPAADDGEKALAMAEEMVSQASAIACTISALSVSTAPSPGIGQGLADWNANRPSPPRIDDLVHIDQLSITGVPLDSRKRSEVDGWVRGLSADHTTRNSTTQRDFIAPSPTAPSTMTSRTDILTGGGEGTLQPSTAPRAHTLSFTLEPEYRAVEQLAAARLEELVAAKKWDEAIPLAEFTAEQISLQIRGQSQHESTLSAEVHLTLAELIFRFDPLSKNITYILDHYSNIPISEIQLSSCRHILATQVFVQFWGMPGWSDFPTKFGSQDISKARALCAAALESRNASLGPENPETQESLMLMRSIDFYDECRVNQWIDSQISPRTLLSPAYHIILHCHMWSDWRIRRGSRGIERLHDLVRGSPFRDTRPELCVSCLHQHSSYVGDEFGIWQINCCNRHLAKGIFNMPPPSLAPIICSLTGGVEEGVQDQKKGGISALLYLWSSDGRNSWSEEARDSIMSGLGIAVLRGDVGLVREILASKPFSRQDASEPDPRYAVDANSTVQDWVQNTASRDKRDAKDWFLVFFAETVAMNAKNRSPGSFTDARKDCLRLILDTVTEDQVCRAFSALVRLGAEYQGSLPNDARNPIFLCPKTLDVVLSRFPGAARDPNLLGTSLSKLGLPTANGLECAKSLIRHGAKPDARFLKQVLSKSPPTKTRAAYLDFVSFLHNEIKVRLSYPLYGVDSVDSNETPGKWILSWNLSLLESQGFQKKVWLAMGGIFEGRTWTTPDWKRGI